MRKTIAFTTMLILFATVIFADEFTKRYTELRDNMYNQGTISPYIHEQLSESINSVMISDLSDEEKLLWTAKFQYISGRVFMEEDIREKSDIEEFKSLEAEESFQKAYDLLGDYIVHNETSDALALRAEILGQLCRLKGMTFTMANGLDIRKMSDRALELDPNNIKALILAANDRVHTPKIFGGKPAEGIEIFERTLSLEHLEEDDLFNIYSGIGIGWERQRNKNEAKVWLSKALEVYPENIYIQRIIEEM